MQKKKFNSDLGFKIGFVVLMALLLGIESSVDKSQPAGGRSIAGQFIQARRQVFAPPPIFQFFRNIWIPRPFSVSDARPVELEFNRVWIVDRNEPSLWQILPAIKISYPKDPIILFGNQQTSEFGPELSHLLSIVGNNASRYMDFIWVSNAQPAQGFSPTKVLKPQQVVAGGQKYTSKTISVGSADLLPYASLLAMRVGAMIFNQPNVTLGMRTNNLATVRATYTFLNKQEILNAINATARKNAIMISHPDHLRPEYVLYAYNRELKWGEVTSPAYDTLGCHETEAVFNVKAQIQNLVAANFNGGVPEALVVASQWNEIPYRYPKFGVPCYYYMGQDIDEFPAEMEYANINDDPWGKPAFMTGRLAAYHQDLLSLQSVAGMFQDFGGFPPFKNGVYHDVNLGIPELNEVYMRKLDAMTPTMSWTKMLFENPPNPGPYTKAQFMNNINPASFIFMWIDGRYDGISFNTFGSWVDHPILQSQELLDNRLTANPAFWFVYACSSGKYVATTPTTAAADKTFITALQRRGALGFVLSVDMNDGDTSFMSIMNIKNGKPVGEVLKDAYLDSVRVLRGEDRNPLDNPYDYEIQTDPRRTQHTTKYLIGDPFTKLVVAPPEGTRSSCMIIANTISTPQPPWASCSSMNYGNMTQQECEDKWYSTAQACCSSVGIPWDKTVTGSASWAGGAANPFGFQCP